MTGTVMFVLLFLFDLLNLYFFQAGCAWVRNNSTKGFTQYTSYIFTRIVCWIYLYMHI